MCSRVVHGPALVLATVAAVLAPSAAVHAAPAAAGTYQFSGPDQALAFEGLGWGHGVGLCQYGARGRALAGQSAEQIVRAYYQGTTIQPAVAPDTSIRVLVHAGLELAAGETRRIDVRGGPWQVVTTNATSANAPAGGAFEMGSAPDGPHFWIKAPDGAALSEGQLRGAIVLRPLDGNTRFAVGYKPAADVPGRPGTRYDTYRGELILSPSGSGGSVWDTVNRLGLQDYLRGVVPSEMPASWHAEALKAQTLAARTYAVWQARNRAGERYDVDDTTRYQVYRGANAEHPNTNAVIDATAGQVIIAGGQVAQAYFFSTCAGWTENNEDVWGGTPLPYLRGIHDLDPSGRPYDADSPIFSWATGALTVAQLQDVLNSDPASEVGRLTSIELGQRTPSGRLKTVRVFGSAGTKTLDPNTLMARFNRLRPNGVSALMSTNFDLKWATAEDVARTQGDVPTPAPQPTTAPAPTAQSSQPTPTAVPPPPPPAAPTPAPTAIPTPVYRLELTQAFAARPNSAANQYFSETGHNVSWGFLSFYRSRGGLDTFGFPRTEEMVEDGQTVQYFQRGRFEYHADKAGTPYEVQLMLLGDALTTPRRPFPPAQSFANAAEHVYFPETGHSLHFAFLRYWQTRGGLDVFGYPISEEIYGENGWPSAVQYFQRARFEYHPELPQPYQVSLGLLGDQYLAQRYWLR